MTTKNAHDLILRIARAFVAHPDSLYLTRQEGEDGCIYWALTCHPEDEPKLIGSHGSHAAALRFIVTQFGRADGVAWTFRAITPTNGFNNERAPQVVAEAYDPTEVKNMLMEILCQFEIGGFDVRVDADEGRRTLLAYRFVITLENPTDYAALTAERKFKHGEGDTMSIKEALNTLYRAMAKVAGVRFKIVVEEPK